MEEFLLQLVLPVGAQPRGVGETRPDDGGGEVAAARINVEDHTKDLQSLVQLDVTMARIALENALTNAATHGVGAIKLTASLDQSTRTNPHSPCVVFLVENAVVPGTAVSPDFVEQLQQAAKHGTKAPQAASTRAGGSVSMSTNSGLRHISFACRAAGGSFDMQLGPTNTTMQVRIVLPARVSALPAMRKGRARGLRTTRPPVAATTPPATSCPNTTTRTTTATPPANLLPDSLSICAIDDSRIICMGYRRLLFPALKACPEQSFVSCAQSDADICDFVERVVSASTDIVLLDQHIDLKAGTEVCGTDLARQLRARGCVAPAAMCWHRMPHPACRGCDVCEAFPKYDVCVCGWVSARVVCTRVLRALNVCICVTRFLGLIVIRTAGETSPAIAHSMQSGDVDGCLGKDSSHVVLAKQIALAYWQKSTAGK
jgi:hypothetical protein